MNEPRLRDAHDDQRIKPMLTLGLFLFDKFEKQCIESGVFTAARNLRKQGVPLNAALEAVRAVRFDGAAHG